MIEAEVVENFSHESEDLALMVRDFVENGSGGIGDTFYSSDSDSGLIDLTQCAKKIHTLRHSIDSSESELVSITQSLIQSISESDLQVFKINHCNASCIRWSLVKLLRLQGYDAAICTSKWQGSGKVPGGDHEYIDVVSNVNFGCSERMIIEIDFRSHFEIARALDAYDAILEALPVVYVGTLSKLKQYLQVMVEASKFSLKQNSMPFPPWRSLAYLQSKWYYAYERNPNLEERVNYLAQADHAQCLENLRRLKNSVQFEIEAERFFKPKTSIISDSARRVRLERWRPNYKL